MALLVADSDVCAAWGCELGGRVSDEQIEVTPSQALMRIAQAASNAGHAADAKRIAALASEIAGGAAEEDEAPAPAISEAENAELMIRSVAMLCFARSLSLLQAGDHDGSREAWDSGLEVGGACLSVRVGLGG